MTREGIAGDRVVQVYDGAGRVVTARTHSRLLAHRATLGPDGEPLVDGRPWRSPEVVRGVVEAAGPRARLGRGPRRFDILPLLVATDGALNAFGHDQRRLRPNLIIGGVEALAERSWGGSGIRIGRAIVGMADLRDRCVMTTWDPDTQEQKLAVLYEIVERFSGKMCLNASVLVEGEIAVGDPVELIPAADLKTAVETAFAGQEKWPKPCTT